MKTITKLTNEYASNLNCLVFNFDVRLPSYYNMFTEIFNHCLVSKDLKVSENEEFRFVDIVFLRVNNNSLFSTRDELRKFIQSLRVYNELLPVYLIKDEITNLDVLDIIDNCYCLDGLVATPFEQNNMYRFLYRVLKRIIVFKELESYIVTLEDQLSVEPISWEQSSLASSKDVKIDKEREKDIRFSQTEKISASDFISSLDDTIVDKVENLSEELDSLVGILYDFDSTEASAMLAEMPKINNTIEEIFLLIDSIGTFQVTARAFGILNKFLASLTLEELSDNDKKSMLIAMLLGIVNDLEKWLQVIFIDQATEDIHYLEASFSSNILEVENLFNETDSNDDDDDDLEFF